jgi:hypothetical protein
MNKLALMLAGVAACVSMTAPAQAADESPAGIAAAMDATTDARSDVADFLDGKDLKAGDYVWRDTGGSGPVKMVISLGDQMGYLYRGDDLVAVTTVSTGKDGHSTPVGVFPVLAKEKMHHSKKYDNAPMPWMQRLDNYGIALHAGHNPGYAASHGCIRLPAAFAKKLYGVTEVGTTVMIGA